MNEMPGKIPDAPCLCFDGGPFDKDDDGPGCMCGISERALRAGVALTQEQREWCLNEIASVEGHSRKDWESENDADLGRGVLSAWTDYCRDKGLM